MESNYTVTMEGDADSLNMQRLTWKDLYAADYGFDTPFELELLNKQILAVKKIIRVLPKRRLVVFGTWREKEVVAKLFIDPKSATRHIEEDVAGVEKLQAHKIPTPSICYRGMSSDQQVQILMLARILKANNLDDIWKNKTSIEEVWPILLAVVYEIATQHVLGVLQHDLHLKNFLPTKKIIYTLDGAQVENFPPLLPKKTSMDNLALFLSQFGVGVEEHQEKLFLHYTNSRGWLIKDADIHEIFSLIRKHDQHRWQQYAKKIFRSCTEFVRIHNWQNLALVNRAYLGTEFLDFVENPDAIFNHSKVTILKAGRSATVIKVVLDNRTLVIKRYNMKNFFHWLRRCLRSSRAAKSWYLAQKLSLFGVATAKPVAFIEKKRWGLRDKSYYVSEYISNQHADEFFIRHAAEEEKISQMIIKVTKLLNNLYKLGITHGDLKITNILIDANEQPYLIDLDGAQEHISKLGLQAAWHKEMKRFLKNFSDQPAIAEKFKQLL